jgi:hypothetical protein
VHKVWTGGGVAQLGFWKNRNPLFLRLGESIYPSSHILTVADRKELENAVEWYLS